MLSTPHRVNLSIFFFQAEAGIRDWSVTGVKTCALPISGPFAVAVPAQVRRDHVEVLGEPARRRVPRMRLHVQPVQQHGRRRTGLPPLRVVQADAVDRSEERRAGKERTYRWWP